MPMTAVLDRRMQRRTGIALAVRRVLARWRPPLERREFWAVQTLVILIAVVHALLEWSHALDPHTPIYLVPISLYLIPILYAALNFGVQGSLPTVVWCGILSLPNVLFFHEGLERWGELAQGVWLAATAIFVGQRVDRERAARLDAERREEARRVSEERYRVIFDSVGEPIVLLNDDHRVAEANAAAAALFGRPVDQLRGHHLPEPLGSAIIASLGQGQATGTALGEPIRTPDGTTWIEAIGTAVVDPAAKPQTQLVLRDVTAQHERERGLEGIARQTLAAREAEQRRIARELHDGPVQSLVALVRKLDALENLAPTEAATLGEARTVAERVADELRRVSRDLRPSILDDLGLTSALHSLAHTFTERTGIKARVVLSGTPRPIGANLELTMLRITEEALRNIERHSGASSATLRLAFAASATRLMISDDGRGMDAIPSPSALLASNRLGLIGMGERARLAGARLSVRSRRHGGLVIDIEAPALDLAPREAHEGEYPSGLERVSPPIGQRPAPIPPR